MLMKIQPDQSGGLAIKEGRRVVGVYDLKAALEFKDPDQIVSDLRALSFYRLSRDYIMLVLDEELPGWMGGK